MYAWLKITTHIQETKNHLKHLGKLLSRWVWYAKYAKLEKKRRE
jgi:hypothetical protein